MANTSYAGHKKHQIYKLRKSYVIFTAVSKLVRPFIAITLIIGTVEHGGSRRSALWRRKKVDFSFFLIFRLS